MAGTVSGTNWAGGDRKDAKLVSDTVAYRAVQTAAEIRDLMARMTSRIGMIDARLLRRVLGDRLSFAQAADLQGKSGERGASYVATRFRDALEALTEAWTAKGAMRATAPDKHGSAADAARDRQQASIEKGVSARAAAGRGSGKPLGRSGNGWVRAGGADQSVSLSPSCPT